MLRQLICILTLPAMSLCVGCGAKPGIEGVVKVAGTVTHQGKPVEGASVIFAPEAPTGRSASGKTDASGRFRLTTLAPEDGALCGKYQVAVSKMEVENPMSADEAKEWFMKHGGPPKAGNIKNHLPEKYKDVQNSGLAAEVTEGGANDFTFDLK